MKKIVLRGYRDTNPLGHTLTVNDDPLFVDGDVSVYELISKYESINITINKRVIGTHNHVAIKDGRVFVYDVDRRECIGSLGSFDVNQS